MNKSELEKKNKQIQELSDCNSRLLDQIGAATKRAIKLEDEIKLLGERSNQLLKDKGDLTDRCRELEQQVKRLQGSLLDVSEKATKRIADLEKENEEMKKGLGCETCQIHLEYMRLNDKIKELEQQIEKMKRHCNCKHRDSEGYCEVKRTYLMDLSYDGCDKWELED